VSRGYTLVEMVTVIVILGITAAAALPAFARVLATDPLRETTLAVEDVLWSARTTALTRATSLSVTLNPETGRYWVSLDSPDDGSTIDSGTVTLGPGVRLQSPVPRPTFRADRLGVTDGDSLLVLGPTGARAIVVDRWAKGVHDEAR
jgi:prepilin-type N-terminal cleavage/methylation domain-containing protein